MYTPKKLCLLLDSKDVIYSKQSLYDTYHGVSEHEHVVTKGIPIQKHVGLVLREPHRLLVGLYLVLKGVSYGLGAPKLGIEIR